MRPPRPLRASRGGGALLIVAFLAGCGGGDSADLGPERRTASGIRLGGTFRWVEVEDMRSLDPVRLAGDIVSWHIGMNVYDGLVEYDQDLNLRPALAERWDVSEDGREYTFHLRPGVRFHDSPVFPGGKGREVTAQDVEYSLLRIADRRNNSTGWYTLQGLIEGLDVVRDGKAESASGIQVVDDRTIRIRLTRRFRPFLKRLAMGYAFVTPREAVEHFGEDFFQHPVGTGPFRFVSWTPNQQVVLERNPHYWEKDAAGQPLPYLDRLEVKLITDAKSAFLNFDTGQLEQLEPIPAEFWTNVFDEQRNLRGPYRKYQVAETVELSTDFYGFYLDAEPWRGNAKLRQAISHAVDRDRIIRFVLKGRNVPAHEWVPPSMPGFAAGEWYRYDLARARARLAEAGYPEGRGLPPLTLQLNSGGTINDLVAEAIQSALAEIGIQVKLQRVAWPQHLESIENGKATFFRFSWIGDYPDAENFLSMLSSRNFSPTGNNYMHYANPDFERLYEEGIGELDDTRAAELYRRAQEVAMADAPMLFLYHAERVHLLQPYVRGFKANPIGLFLAKYWWLENALRQEGAPQTAGAGGAAGNGGAETPGG